MRSAGKPYDAMAEGKDEPADEAARPEPGKKKARWLKLGSIAAAAALAAGLGAGALSGKLPWLPIGGSTGPGGSAGNSGHDGGATFMSYAGPVFPLTAADGGEGLTAARELTYDFALWTPEWKSVEDMADESIENGSVWTREELLKLYRKNWPKGGYYIRPLEVQVTDAYTLTNSAGEDKPVKLLYPFVSNLHSLAKDRPVLRLDGTELDATLRVGGYSGGFQGAGLTDSPGTVNLRQFNSWTQYRDLLADGGYQRRAMEDFPDLSAVPVTVYEFTNAWGPEAVSGEMNPTVHASFSLDYSETVVLGCGFNGGCFDQEAGTMNQSFSVPRSTWPDYDEPRYLFVIGGPVRDWTVYVSSGGAPEAGEDMEFGVEAGVDVRRYGTDLERALRMAAEQMYAQRYGGEAQAPDFELYFGLMKDTLLCYGTLSADPKERYSTGWLEELDGDVVDRVFYLEADVTVPAGGSATVEAGFLKSPSMDFACARTENEGVYGYDMVTGLGASLEFTRQTAAAVNTQYAQIVRQNFGFDWENGVSVVTLDPDVEHYYLEVRRTEMD